MSTSLDGVKKINPEEIKKLRQVVLNYIEKDNSTKEEKPKEFISDDYKVKKVDSLRAGSDAKLASKNQPKNFFGNIGILKRNNTPADKSEIKDNKNGPAVLEKAKPEIKATGDNKTLVNQSMADMVNNGAEKRKIPISSAQDPAKSKNKTTRNISDAAAADETLKINKTPGRNIVLNAPERKKEEFSALSNKNKGVIVALNAKENLSLKTIFFRNRVEPQENNGQAKKLVLPPQELKNSDDNFRQKELKRQERINRDLENKLIKEQAKRKKLIEKIRSRKKLANKLFKIKKEIKTAFSSSWQNFNKYAVPDILFVLRAIAIAMLVTVVSYLSFSFLLLKLHVDNDITRKIAGYFPVPALITDYGFVSFYDYLDARNKLYQSYISKAGELNMLNQIDEATTKYLTTSLIYNNLNKRYSAVNQKDFSHKILLDDINSQNLLRIKRIKSLLDGGYSFNQLNNYADSYSNTAQLSQEAFKAKFGQAAYDLPMGQLSKIIIGRDGYYIIKKYWQNGDIINYEFIFVRPVTLEQYLKEQAASAKVYNLSRN